MNDLKIKYYDEEIDIFNEVAKVNEKTFTVTLDKIPSKRKIFIKHGYINLTEVEIEPNVNEFKVDRSTGVILFNSTMSGERVIIDYSAIGKFCMSADKVFTNVDSNGNVIETLEGYLQKNKEIIDSVNTIGDGATVFNQLEAHIESAKNLMGNVIEGGNVNDKLVKTINNSKKADTNLNESINSANTKITEMNEWVDQHGDIVNLDNRVDNVESHIPKINEQLDNMAILKNVTSTTELINCLNDVENNCTVKIVGVVNLTSQFKISNKHNIIIDFSMLTLNLDKANYVCSSADKPMILFENCTNITIQKGLIDGKCTTQETTVWTNYIYGMMFRSCSNITLDGTTIQNSYSQGLYVLETNEFVIKNCKILDCVYTGINFSKCAYGVMSSNVIKGKTANTGTNTLIGGIGILGSLSSDITIKENTIQEMADTGSKCEGGKNISYLYNKLKRCGKDGIKVQGSPDDLAGDKYIYNVKIIGNTVEEMVANRSDGSSMIRIHDCKGGQIESNYCDNTKGCLNRNGISGIKLQSDLTCSDMVISNNICKTKETYSISFTTSTVNQTNIQINNNNTDNGIQVEMFENLIVNGNTCSKININNSDGDISINNNNIVNGTLQIYAKINSLIKTLNINNNSIKNDGLTYTIRVQTNTNSIINSVAINNNTCIYEGIPTNAIIRFQLTDGSKIKKCNVGEQNVIFNGLLATDTFTKDIFEFTGSVTNPIVEVLSVNSYSNKFLCTNGNVVIKPWYTIPYTHVKRITGVIYSYDMPTTGTWYIGDIVYNNTPRAGKYSMWQCSADGTPGTWIGINLIS